MKIRTLTLLAFMALFHAAAFAQNDQKNIFRNYPEHVALSTEAFYPAFSAQPGSSVNINIGESLNFTGEIVSNVEKFSGSLHSVIIRSNQLDGALLHVSRSLNNDKVFEYRARIFHEGSAEGYEMTKTTGGNYQLVKFKTKDKLQDCSFQ